MGQPTLEIITYISNYQKRYFPIKIFTMRDLNLALQRGGVGRGGMKLNPFFQKVVPLRKITFVPVNAISRKKNLHEIK